MESIGSIRGLERSLVNGIAEHESGAPGPHGRLRGRLLLYGILGQVAERLGRQLRWRQWRRDSGAQDGLARRPRVAVAGDYVVERRRWGFVRRRKPEVPASEIGRSVPGAVRAVPPVVVRVAGIPVTTAPVLLLLQVGGQRHRVRLVDVMVVVRTNHAVRVRGHGGTPEPLSPVRLFGRRLFGHGTPEPLVPEQLFVRGRFNVAVGGQHVKRIPFHSVGGARGSGQGTAESFAPVRLFGRRRDHQLGVLQVSRRRRLADGRLEQPDVVVALVPPRLGGRLGLQHAYLARDEPDRGVSDCGRQLELNALPVRSDVLQRVVHVLPVFDVLVKLARLSGRLVGRQW